MGIWAQLRSLLRGGASERPAFHYWVKCGGCGELIRVRVDPISDLEQEFQNGTDSVSGYVLHKEILGNNCTRLLHLEVQYDRGRRELGTAVEGGEITPPPPQ